MKLIKCYFDLANVEGGKGIFVGRGKVRFGGCVVRVMAYRYRVASSRNASGKCPSMDHICAVPFCEVGHCQIETVLFVEVGQS